MPTLNDYRRQAGYKTIKAFAEAAQRSGIRADGGYPFTPSIASQWLHGHRGDIYPTPLLALLHITQEQYYEACQASRDAYMANWRKKHPPLTEGQRAQIEAERKAWCDERWSKMTDAERQRVHEDAVRLGIARPERRSPLDILIDRACGID